MLPLSLCVDGWRVLAVSPHYGDAVFACGDFLAAHPGARVVTVFSAGPAPGDTRLRAWDADCGFLEGDDVVRARRAEDLAGVSLLGASPIWLPFRHAQYGPDAGVPEISQALADVIHEVRPSLVAIPLGIFHHDHLLATQAALAVRARHPRLTWLAYEDAIYRRFPDDPVGARVVALRRAGFEIESTDLGGRPASGLKRRAVACYRSQLRGLATAGRSGHGDALAPEAYWQVRAASQRARARPG